MNTQVMLFLHRPCGIRRKYLLKIIMDRKYINEEKTNWFNVVPNFGFNAVSICPSEIRRSEFPKYIWKNHIWGSWLTNAAKCKINYPSCIALDLLLRYSDIAFLDALASLKTMLDIKWVTDVFKILPPIVWYYFNLPQQSITEY